jgi:hypothetical protein
MALLLTPRVYFSNPAVFQDQRAALAGALLAGMASAMDRIDQKLASADLRQQDVAGNSWLAWATESWPHYWMVVAISGLVSAMLVWFVGGWWYKKRLQWSGARDVTMHDARRAHVLKELVYSAPALLLTLVQTLIYNNYSEAWNSDHIVAMVALVFVFWSCWTSYCAATSAFPVKRNNAMVWFLVLPVLFYGLVLGGFAMLFATLK